MTTAAHDLTDDGWSDDGTLAQSYLAGTTESFALLFRRYYPDLVAFLAPRVGDHALAEDLAQETMARALRHLAGFDPRRPFWPWVKAIASRLAAVECARRLVETPTDDVAAHGPRAYADNVETFISREEVEACLARIPRRHRRALVMRYVEERDSRDIATLFGLSRGALEQLMWRARQNLAREYRERNAAPWLPGYAALAARVRRILSSLSARVQAAAGAGFSVAGDVALGTAITIGGVTIATGVMNAGTQPASAAFTTGAVAGDPTGTVPYAIARGTTGTTIGTSRVAGGVPDGAVATSGDTTAGSADSGYPAATVPGAAGPGTAPGPATAPAPPGSAAYQGHDAAPAPDDSGPVEQEDVVIDPPSSQSGGVWVSAPEDIPANASAETTVDPDAATGPEGGGVTYLTVKVDLPGEEDIVLAVPVTRGEGDGLVCVTTDLLCN
jgi:RNA polymerase sigma-70 factor (ECF subfamily)